MTTTISKSGKRNHIGETPLSRAGDHFGRGGDHQGSIAYDLDGDIREEPKTGSSAVAFFAGAKAIIPVLLAVYTVMRAGAKDGG